METKHKSELQVLQMQQKEDRQNGIDADSYKAREYRLPIELLCDANPSPEHDPTEPTLKDAEEEEDGES